MRILEEFWYGNIEPTDYDTSYFLMLCVAAFCFDFCPTWAEVGRQYTKEEINDQRI